LSRIETLWSGRRSGPTIFLYEHEATSFRQRLRSPLAGAGAIDKPTAGCPTQTRQEMTMSNEEIDNEDEIVLADLPDDELVKQMHDDLYDGLAEEIVEGTNILLGRGWSPSRTLDEALVAGMTIVGIDFRDGILFVPEVLLAANSMKAGMVILRPLLAETGAKPVGKMVIGTVKGDIHDIGKNLVGMMMEGAGFEVINLGINTPVEKYMEALEEHQPDILGMSALLTTTMPYMKVVIDTLKSEGIRDNFIVMVGGAPLNDEFASAIGADAYCRDAATAVETAKKLVGQRAQAA
jgi:methylmalonyl-CoA mutase cobalamin-binding domain/chain